MISIHYGYGWYLSNIQFIKQEPECNGMRAHERFLCAVTEYCGMYGLVVSQRLEETNRTIGCQKARND